METVEGRGARPRPAPMSRSPARLGQRVSTALLAVLLGLSGCGGEDAPTRRPNLLLVTIDTLRADALGCYGGATPTPTLDALAARGARFEAMTSASSWTLPSLATLMTGRHAATHGAIDDRHGLTDELPVLAERAAAAGYATHGIGSHIFLGERYGLQRGFATYDDDGVLRPAALLEQGEQPTQVVIGEPHLSLVQGARVLLVHGREALVGAVLVVGVEGVDPQEPGLVVAPRLEPGARLANQLG